MYYKLGAKNDAAEYWCSVRNMMLCIMLGASTWCCWLSQPGNMYFSMSVYTLIHTHSDSVGEQLDHLVSAVCCFKLFFWPLTINLWPSIDHWWQRLFPAMLRLCSLALPFLTLAFSLSSSLLIIVIQRYACNVCVCVLHDRASLCAAIIFFWMCVCV